MKKLFGTLIVVLFFAANANAYSVAEEASMVCWNIASAAERAAGGNNYEVFSATYDACETQMQAMQGQE